MQNSNLFPSFWNLGTLHPELLELIAQDGWGDRLAA
jgi:hypothetical protein